MMFSYVSLSVYHVVCTYICAFHFKYKIACSICKYFKFIHAFYIIIFFQYRTPDSVNAAVVPNTLATSSCQLINIPVQPNETSTLVVSGPSCPRGSKNINSNVVASRRQQHRSNSGSSSDSKNSHHVVSLTTSLSSPNLNTAVVLSSCSSSESEVRLATSAHKRPIMQ